MGEEKEEVSYIGKVRAVLQDFRGYALDDIVIENLTSKIALLSVRKENELKISKKDLAEKIGQESDRIENLIAGLQLPISSEMHLEGIGGVLPDIQSALKRICIEDLEIDFWD